MKADDVNRAFRTADENALALIRGVEKLLSAGIAGHPVLGVYMAVVIDDSGREGQPQDQRMVFGTTALLVPHATTAAGLTPATILALRATVATAQQNKTDLYEMDISVAPVGVPPAKDELH